MSLIHGYLGFVCEAINTFIYRNNLRIEFKFLLKNVPNFV